MQILSLTLLIVILLNSINLSLVYSNKNGCDIIELGKINKSFEYNEKNKEYIIDGQYYGIKKLKDINYEKIGLFGDGYYLKMKENGKEIFKLYDGYKIIADDIEFFISNDKQHFILWIREGKNLIIIKDKKILYKFDDFNGGKNFSLTKKNYSTDIFISMDGGEKLKYTLDFLNITDKVNFIGYKTFYSNDFSDYLLFDSIMENIFSKKLGSILEGIKPRSLMFNGNTLVYSYDYIDVKKDITSIEDKKLKKTNNKASIDEVMTEISDEYLDDILDIIYDPYKETFIGNRIIVGKEKIKIDGNLISYDFYNYGNNIIYAFKKGKDYFIVNNGIINKYNNRINFIDISPDGKKLLILFFDGEIKTDDIHLPIKPKTHIDINGLNLGELNINYVMGNFSNDSEEYVFMSTQYNNKEKKEESFLLKYTCNAKKVYKNQLKVSGENLKIKLKSKINKIVEKMSLKKADLIFNKIQKLSKKIRKNKKYKDLIDYLEAKLYFKI